ncbi:MAG: hypothetical protein EZS28_035282 [Streblomastix strix]|uniref:Uncharacterized protein n=1 Tax=Streblomastix strix TaxID=222440 RepID=A0A5J4UH08_9EUKA|nr:MAG: hypothetical protein EZS28_035282 [Streblomastix strix]
MGGGGQKQRGNNQIYYITIQPTHMFNDELSQQNGVKYNEAMVQIKPTCQDTTSLSAAPGMGGCRSASESQIEQK